jgi:hypothetical protein
LKHKVRAVSAAGFNALTLAPTRRCQEVDNTGAASDMRATKMSDALIDKNTKFAGAFELFSQSTQALFQVHTNTASC